MQAITLDMAVLDINEVKIGKIGAVRRCCFEVMRSTDTGRSNLTPAALYNVENGRVTLICGVLESRQYECLIHSPGARNIA
jgi:hypothetical protein